MEIYGMSGLNFTDFAGRPANTLFLAGCNLRCSFCHNKEVVNGVNREQLSISFVKAYMQGLRMNIPAVGIVFSGGEPTINKYFDRLCEEFKDYPMAIHTNGLVLPQFWENPFEAVVLSLKPRSEFGGWYGNTEYMYLINRAMRFYENAKHKEIRIVDSDSSGLAGCVDMLYTLRDDLKVDISSWKLNCIDNTSAASFSEANKELERWSA